MSLREVLPGVYVAPQLGPESMAQAADAGFRSVVNNRPDLEAGTEQPTSASIEAAARAAGLEYRFLPIPPMTQTDDDVRAMAALLAELPRPLLLFCRSGNRSARLALLAQQLE